MGRGTCRSVPERARAPRRDQGPRQRPLQGHGPRAARRRRGRGVGAAAGRDDGAVPLLWVAHEALLRRVAQGDRLRLVRAGGLMDDATKVVHAGQDGARQGEPFLPGPAFAAPFHLAGAVDSAPFGYGREDNPTWRRYEQALGSLEDADAVLFSSGMAAVAAVVLPALKPGDVFVAPADGYPGLRAIADEHLTPRGVTTRFVPTNAQAYADALGDATLVW